MHLCSSTIPPAMPLPYMHPHDRVPLAGCGQHRQVQAEVAEAAALRPQLVGGRRWGRCGGGARDGAGHDGAKRLRSSATTPITLFDYDFSAHWCGQKRSRRRGARSGKRARDAGKENNPGDVVVILDEEETAPAGSREQKGVLSEWYPNLRYREEISGKMV